MALVWSMYVNSQSAQQRYDKLMYIPQNMMSNAVLKLLDFLLSKAKCERTDNKREQNGGTTI